MGVDEPPVKRAKADLGNALVETGARICLVNAGRLDFDSTLDTSCLQELGAVTIWLEEPSNDEAVIRRAMDHNVLITKEFPLPASVIRRLPASVRLVVEAGTGYNNIDLDAARDRGIAVCNVPSYSSEAVAQLVLTFILALSSSLVPQARLLERGDHRCFTRALDLPHFELQGKTLGLIGGRGEIGQQVARLAQGLSMKVLVSTRQALVSDGIPGVQYTSSVEDLLTASDFVSLHCPLTPATRHMLSAERLALMKPTAYIINTARGPIIDEEALIEALEAGKLAGAALDVQAVEPPSQDSPLYTLPSVILTPHIGWKRKETRQRLLQQVANNIAAFLRSEPENIVS